MATIKFICRSCEHMNSMETGMDGYKQRDTEFFNFTDAWLHVHETNRFYDTNAHHVEAIVNDDED